MGWFTKKKKEDEVPELPELPKLPELDDRIEKDEAMPRVPGFPIDSLEQELSQNTIKEAVSGQKEGKEVLGADEFAEDKMQRMPKPLPRLGIPKPPKFPQVREPLEVKKRTKEKLTREISSSAPFSPEKRIPLTREISARAQLESIEPRKIGKAEPVFIRIDKFEETLNIFEETKRKIAEIEKDLKDIKRVKEAEENEINSWEKEIQYIKEQMERIDKDIFSRIE